VTPFSKIQINVNATGIGTIIVDGKDISGMVSGANVRIRAGKFTRVFMQLTADVVVDAEGELSK
jgi:hypothetical protein